MKIYIAHSREFDYENKLYKPIRNNFNRDDEIILPHENNINNDRNYYKDIDLMIAEVSYPSTGLGIELGWAYDDNIPLYCIYNNEKSISSSINAITNNLYEYNNEEEMIEIIDNIINIEYNKNDNKTL